MNIKVKSCTAVEVVLGSGNDLLTSVVWILVVRCRVGFSEVEMELFCLYNCGFLIQKEGKAQSQVLVSWMCVLFLFLFFYFNATMQLSYTKTRLIVQGCSSEAVE